MITDTTIRDLRDDRNLVDAEHALTRAELAAEKGDVGPLQAWARTWGRAAIVALQTMPPPSGAPRGV